MIITAQWLVDNFGSFLGGFALLWLTWREAERKRIDTAIGSLSTRINGIELSMVRDMPSKEDVDKLGERLDQLVATLTEVRDMVVRQDERSRIHDRE